MYFERFKPFDFELITDNILNELEEDAELGLCDMELIEKPETPSYSQATNMAAPASFIDDSMFDDAEEQKSSPTKDKLPPAKK